MQPDQRDAGYLFDMLQFAREAVEIVAETPAEIYLADVRSRRALERTISLIGEAANHVSREFQAAHADIPWSEIIGQRHWLVHGYREVESRRLLDVVEKRLPQLIARLLDLIPPIPSELDET